MKRLSTWFALILIASASLLSAANSGGGNEKHQNQASTYHRSSERKPDKAAPSFTIVVQPAPVQVIQQATTEEKKHPAEKWYERPTVTDWGVLIVTFAYVVISIGLLAATKRQAHLANEALIETRKASEFAERSLRLTQRAEVTLGRPDGKLAEIVEPRVGETLKIRVFLTNSGQTAARDFRAKQVVGGIGHGSTSIDLRPEPVRKQIAAQGYVGYVGMSTSTIASGAVVTHIARSADPLTGEDVEKIRRRELRVTVIGKYEYDDGFGNGEWRLYWLTFDPTIGEFDVMDLPLPREVFG